MYNTVNKILILNIIFKDLMINIGCCIPIYNKNDTQQCQIYSKIFDVVIVQISIS